MSTPPRMYLLKRIMDEPFSSSRTVEPTTVPKQSNVRVFILTDLPDNGSLVFYRYRFLAVDLAVHERRPRRSVKTA